MNALLIGLGWEQTELLEYLGNICEKIYVVPQNGYNGINSSESIITINNDINSIDNIIKSLKGIDIQVVISDQCDYSQLSAALIAEKLNIYGPSVKGAYLGLDKAQQRALVENANLLVPKNSTIKSLGEIHDFFSKSGSNPIIIKPVDNRGSIGITKVSNIESLDKSYNLALENSERKLVIAERFITGTEFSIDSIAGINQPILSIGRKYKYPTNPCVAKAINYSNKIANGEQASKLIDNHHKVVESLGYQKGLVHAEYILDANDLIYFVEAANRGGGCKTSSIVDHYLSSFDVNKFLYESYIRPDITNLISIEENKDKNCCLFFADNETEHSKFLMLIEENREIDLMYSRILNPDRSMEESGVNNDAQRYSVLIFSYSDCILILYVQSLKLIQIDSTTSDYKI